MQSHTPELLYIAITFCESYKKVFGKEYWLGKKWIRGAVDPRTQNDFEDVRKFFHDHGVKGHVYAATIRGYMTFAIKHFQDLGKRPTPQFLIDERLLRSYFATPVSNAPQIHEDVDYRKILDPGLADDEELMRFMGLIK